MPNANDKSGSDSTSEQPSIVTSTRQESKSANKPKKKIKGAKVRAISGSDSTSEQP